MLVKLSLSKMTSNNLVDPNLIDAKFWTSWPTKFTSIGQYENRKERDQKKKSHADSLKETHMGSSVKRRGEPDKPPQSPKKPRSESDDFLTEDEIVEDQCKKKKDLLEKNTELFLGALKDHGVNKTMQKVAG